MDERTKILALIIALGAILGTGLVTIPMMEEAEAGGNQTGNQTGGAGQISNAQDPDVNEGPNDPSGNPIGD